jgi:hypothetical protein
MPAFQTYMKGHSMLNGLFNPPANYDAGKTRIYHYNPSSKTLEFDPMPEKGANEEEGG